MAKNITFDTIARDSLKKGVDSLANAVKVPIIPARKPTDIIKRTVVEI